MLVTHNGIISSNIKEDLKMKRSIERECPYCGEPLKSSTVILDNDIGVMRENVDGVFRCISKECIKSNWGPRPFRVNHGMLVEIIMDESPEVDDDTICDDWYDDEIIEDEE